MEINITIKGRTPLLCNKFTDAAQLAASGVTSRLSTNGSKGEPHEVAEGKLYLDSLSAQLVATRAQFEKVSRKQFRQNLNGLAFVNFKLLLNLLCHGATTGDINPMKRTRGVGKQGLEKRKQIPAGVGSDTQSSGRLTFPLDENLPAQRFSSLPQ